MTTTSARQPDEYETSPLTRAYYAQRKSELIGILATLAVSIAIRKAARSRGKLDRDGKSTSLDYSYGASLASNTTGYIVTKLLRKRGW